MAQAMAAAYSGLSNFESIPDEQRIWDRDKQIIKYAKGSIAISRIVMENFAKGGKKPTGDMHVKYKSDIARQAMIAVADNSVNGNATEDKIFIADKFADYVDEGATLVLRDYYYNGTTFAASSFPSLGNTQREKLLVLQRGTSDGTNTWFLVKRGFQPASGGSAGTPGNIATGSKIIVTNRAIAEGSNEARVWGDTPFEEYNYCEMTLEKWGQTQLSKDAEFYQDESLSQRNGQRLLDLFYKKFEMKCLFGSRHSEIKNGRRIWRSGGLDEYIEQPNTDIGYVPYDGDPTNAAGENRIIDFQQAYGAISSQNLNTMLSNKFYWGNQTEKMWIMSNEVYTRIANAYDNKVRIQFNKELSLKYGLRINTIESSAGGAVHLIQHDLLSIYGMGNATYFLDFDDLKYMHLKNQDMMLLMNVEKYLNIFEEVNYLYLNAGLLRRNPFSKYKILFDLTA